MNYRISISVLLSFLMFLAACGNKPETRGAENKNTRPQGKDMLVEINKFLTDKDKDVIENFIRRQGWKMEFSPTGGFYYEVFEQGAQPLIVDGNYVTYDYTASLLNGTVCYTTKSGEPSGFLVGRSEDIMGLHLAITMLGKGGRGRFIFPPYLAHGLQGDGNKIPPRAILLYDINVIDVE